MKNKCVNCGTFISQDVLHSKYCLNCRMKYGDQIKAKERREREILLEEFNRGSF